MDPIPASSYEHSQYYVPICTVLPLCIGWYLSRFSPWSKRSPYLVLTGLSMSVIIIFLQSFRQTCLYHTVWRLLLQPTLAFACILLPGYRYNINCRFRDAMQETNTKEHIKLLLRLKWEASYPHMIMLFAACITPQICCIMATAIFTDDFTSNEKNYRAYGNEGFCVSRVYEKALVVICGILYALGGINMLRKFKGSKDHFGISTSLLKVFRYAGVITVVYAILLAVGNQYLTFYYMRALIISNVVYIVGINSYDVWVFSRKYQQRDSKQGGDFDLDHILNSPRGLSAFRKQLVDEFAGENLAFWTAVTELEQEGLAAGGSFVGLDARVENIFNLYISETAPLQVNVSGKVLLKLKAEVQGGSYSPTMFSAAKEEIHMLMASDSLPRFRRSSHFEAFKQAHQLEEDVGVDLTVAESSRVLSLYLSANLPGDDEGGEMGDDSTPVISVPLVLGRGSSDEQ